MRVNTFRSTGVSLSNTSNLRKSETDPWFTELNYTWYAFTSEITLWINMDKY